MRGEHSLPCKSKSGEQKRKEPCEKLVKDAKKLKKMVIVEEARSLSSHQLADSVDMEMDTCTSENTSSVQIKANWKSDSGIESCLNKLDTTTKKQYDACTMEANPNEMQRMAWESGASNMWDIAGSRQLATKSPGPHSVYNDGWSNPDGCAALPPLDRESYSEGCGLQYRRARTARRMGRETTSDALFLPHQHISIGIVVSDEQPYEDIEPCSASNDAIVEKSVGLRSIHAPPSTCSENEPSVQGPDFNFVDHNTHHVLLPPMGSEPIHLNKDDSCSVIADTAITNSEKEHDPQTTRYGLHPKSASSSHHGRGSEAGDPTQRLIRAGKLCLVLDLDHVLLNSCKFNEVSEDDSRQLEAILADENCLPESCRELYKMHRFSTWTKLRPGVRQFLISAAEKFELWIHTQRSKSYAKAIVKLLDRTGDLIGGRVIMQSKREGVKSLCGALRGVKPAVLIVDDVTVVWSKECIRNVLAVQRYLYFPSSRRRSRMPGKSLLQIQRDEAPDQGMLMLTLNNALRVHNQVMEIANGPLKGLKGCWRGLKVGLKGWRGVAAGEDPWDVRGIAKNERAKVLQGVFMVFTHIVSKSQRIELHPLWKMALQFGAKCGLECTKETTHVVATVPGTEKVAWGLQNHKYVVTPNWLECSCALWRRASEDRFQLRQSQGV